MSCKTASHVEWLSGTFWNVVKVLAVTNESGL